TLQPYPAILGRRMSTPQQYLDTSFIRDEQGRIVWTQEAVPTPGPLFCLVRGASRCAWSVHADLPDDVAHAIDRLARSEPPTADFRRPPIHVNEYRKLLGAYISSWHGAMIDPLEQSGPAMTFPDALPQVSDVVRVEDERLLAIEFRGWVIGEIAGGRTPVLAVFEDGHPVSLCFCARASAAAAEAGVETAGRYRGRGLAPRVTAAWAHTLRAEGRTPLYSTQWTNQASLAVARKLGLTTYASTWCLGDGRK
ncbi:MAG: GCN5-related N-acetyltransferase, partial [Phycisphaerales bacterium]|nr:GCN5-related N-acetyltransferase [Phycisphaerales bacterium]